jgi:limonene-1,2-epoxide hydrolase
VTQVSDEMERRLEVVRKLYAKFSHIDPDELTDMFTDNACVHMMPKDPYIGRGEIHRMFTIWGTAYGNVYTPLTNIVGQGNVVMTEWLDQSDFGGAHYAIPCMGVFEFDGDRISAWRVYYDYAMEAPQAGVSGLKPRREQPT